MPLVWWLIMAPLKTELAHATLKLDNRSLDVLHGKMCEAGVTIRPASDLGGKGIVSLSRSLDGKLSVALDLDHPSPSWRARRA